MSFSQTSTLVLGPPRWLAALLAGCTALALLGICIAGLPASLKSCLCVAAPMLALRQWRTIPRGRLQWRPGGGIRLSPQNAGPVVGWQLLDGICYCWITPGLIILQVRHTAADARGSHWLILDRQANDNDSWRRLRVALNWNGQWGRAPTC